MTQVIYAIFVLLKSNIAKYIRQMGLIFTGVLKQTHTYLLLESDLCYKMFSNLYRIYSVVEPGECFASERVMLVHINKLSFTSFAIREKILEKNSCEDWNSRSQKIKVKF